MDGFELQAALNDTLAQNQEAINGMREQGRRMAQARARYKAALASKALALRADGMSVGLIHDVARGDPEVAALGADADAQEALYDACREEVMLRKREADTIREQLQREWGEQGRAY